MKKIILSLSILFLFVCGKVEAATYYAINTGSLNWSSSASWATSSNQSTGGAGVPTASDTVFLDAFSSNITVNTTTCVAASVDATGYTKTWTFTAGEILSVSGNVTFPSGTNGTIAGTGVLDLHTSSTVTPNSITFPGTINSSGGTVTLGGDLTVTGSFTNRGGSAGASVTLSGAHNLTVGTLLLIPAATGASSFIIPAGQTVTMTTGFTVVGIQGIFAAGNYTSENLTIKSGTGSSSAFIHYNGPSTGQKVTTVLFTDIDATGGNMAIYNYGGQTLTRTAGIYNVSAANIGGLMIQ